MLKRALAALTLGVTLDACGANQEIADLGRRAEETVLLENRRFHLDVYANRDFMPMNPPTGVFYVLVQFRDDHGASPSSGVRADSVWIIDRSSRWTALSWKTRLISRSDAFLTSGYRADLEEGPAAGARIDVVVRLYDAAGRALLLTAKDVRVFHTA